MPYVATRLGRLFYEEFGDDRTLPPLVLLHGLYFDRAMWRYQVPVLSAMRSTLVFDMPGHGRSAVPSPFTLEQQADAFTDALRALTLRRIVPIGLSWGGMLAMRLALRHPELVDGLALLSTSASAEKLKQRVLAHSLSRIGRAVGLPPLVFDRYVSPMMYGRRARRTMPELAAESRRRLSAMDPVAVVRTTDAVVVHRTSVLARLHQIRVPTMVLCGDHDNATPLAQSRRIVERIPGATLTIVPDTGHLTAEESPDAVNRALAAFIETL